MFNKIIGLLLAFFTGLLIWVLVNQIEITEDKPKLQATHEVSVPDFAAIENVAQKKQAFVEFLLPAIREANDAIMLEREFLLGLNLKKLAQKDLARLQALAEKYQEDFLTQDLEKTYRNLLIKVDEIPASLALAQAANESAWGTSRFARQGCNFYGQWCFSEGCGLVPLARGAGKTHEVRVFKSAKESVAAYMLNLNSFHTYKDLRALRVMLRSQGKDLSGIALAEGLLDYSERREAYIKELQQMIRFNKFNAFD